MGYAFNGICYQSPDQVLEQFQLSYPMVGDTALITLQSASLSPSGIDYALLSSPFSGTPTIRTGTLALTPCETPSLAQYPLQSMALPIVLCFAFFSGFRTGFRP